ncbi:DMT family transporter [Candidatus Daviesbacteria bacterium]|nr:DMT family transporter [Candidatus Daviesbacteria bacterium]
MTIGIISLFIANFVGGAIIPLFVKLGVGEMPPVLFTVLRFSIAFLILLPIYLKHQSLKINRQNFKWIFITSIFFTINVGLYSIGIQYTNVIISQILYAFVPVIVAFLGHFLLKERITKHEAIGSAVAFLGLVFLISQSFGEQITFGRPLGNIIIMVGVISWSFYIILSRKITNSSSRVSMTLSNFLIAAVMLSILLPFEYKIRPFSLSEISSLGIISVLIVAVASVAFINLLQVGIKRTDAFIASLFSYIGPLSASITAVPFLGEKITLNLILGGILIIFGVFYAVSYLQLKKYFISKYGLSKRTS